MRGVPYRHFAAKQATVCQGTQQARHGVQSLQLFPDGGGGALHRTVLRLRAALRRPCSSPFPGWPAFFEYLGSSSSSDLFRFDKVATEAEFMQAYAYGQPIPAVP